MNHQNTPQPIDTAPRDVVILTDQGMARYVDQKQRGSAESNGWYLCGINGHIVMCADIGMEVSRINPKQWMPVPAFN